MSEQSEQCLSNASGICVGHMHSAKGRACARTYVRNVRTNEEPLSPTSETSPSVTRGRAYGFPLDSSDDAAVADYQAAVRQRRDEYNALKKAR